MLYSAAFSTVLAALAIAPSTLAVVNYPNDFIDPAPILSYQYDDKATIPAQQTIIQWANSLAKAGPWGMQLAQLTFD